MTGVPHGGERERRRLPLPPAGLHNAANAAGVAIVLMRLGFPRRRSHGRSSGSRGIRRRRRWWESSRILVVDDFAHHPTASGRRSGRSAPGTRIDGSCGLRAPVAHQPRKVFQREFTAALSGADE